MRTFAAKRKRSALKWYPKYSTSSSWIRHAWLKRRRLKPRRHRRRPDLRFHCKYRLGRTTLIVARNKLSKRMNRAPWEVPCKLVGTARIAHAQRSWWTCLRRNFLSKVLENGNHRRWFSRRNSLQMMPTIWRYTCHTSKKYCSDNSWSR